MPFYVPFCTYQKAKEKPGTLWFPCVPGSGSNRTRTYDTPGMNPVLILCTNHYLSTFVQCTNLLWQPNWQRIKSYWPRLFRRWPQLGQYKQDEEIYFIHFGQRSSSNPSPGITSAGDCFVIASTRNDLLIIVCVAFWENGYIVLKINSSAVSCTLIVILLKILSNSFSIHVCLPSHVRTDKGLNISLDGFQARQVGNNVRIRGAVQLQMILPGVLVIILPNCPFLRFCCHKCSPKRNCFPIHDTSSSNPRQTCRAG